MNVAPAAALSASWRRAGSAAEFGKVAVLYGGLSAEREVSLQSGAAVLTGLQEGGVDAHPLDVGSDVLQHLADGGYDRVFNILHGRGGEDGTIQGALELLGLPCTGSGVLGSALAMDKQRTKLMCQAVGLPVAPSQPVASVEALAAASDDIGFPVAVKPVHEGSSIGMTRVVDADGLDAAWDLARQHDDQIMVERWLQGEEYTLGIVGREVLPAIRLQTPREFYDYEAKYADGAGTQYHCPCGLDADEEARLQVLALAAFDAVGASGWGRIDLIRDQHGPWLLEVNTTPGMTSHSLVPMAAREHGWSFAELVWRILETTL